MSNYVTYSEVQTYKLPGGRALNLSSYTEEEVQAIIDAKEQLIERITNDIFYPKTETYHFDGTGKRHLYFPPSVNYSLITPTQVVDLDNNNTTIHRSYTEHTDYKNYGHSIELLDYMDSKRINIIRGSGWPKAQKNIRVTGTWGHLDTPYEIKQVVLMLIAAEVDPSSAQILGLIDGNVKQLEWEDFKIEFQFDAKREIYKGGTGYIKIDRILSRYVNNASLMFTTF